MLEPDLVRIARIGLGRDPATSTRRADRLERHPRRRREPKRPCSSPATRTSSSWPAWSSTETRQRRRRPRPFGVADDRPGRPRPRRILPRVGGPVAARRPARRRPSRDRGATSSRRSRPVSTRCGLGVKVDRVRVVDAHPPREVVPAYRDVSAAVSDVERLRNEAEAYAAERALSATAEAQFHSRRGPGQVSRPESPYSGRERRLPRAGVGPRGQPGLTEFRLLWSTLGLALADRPKLILDPRAGGRRQVWLADPERFGLDVLSPLSPTDRPNRSSNRKIKMLAGWARPTIILIEGPRHAPARPSRGTPPSSARAPGSSPRRFSWPWSSPLRSVVLVDQTEVVYITEFGRPVR